MGIDIWQRSLYAVAAVQLALLLRVGPQRRLRRRLGPPRAGPRHKRLRLLLYTCYYCTVYPDRTATGRGSRLPLPWPVPRASDTFRLAAQGIF